MKRTEEQRERMIGLRDDIMKPPDGVIFNMQKWHKKSPEGCGTAACIAGLCVLLHFPEDAQDPENMHSSEYVERLADWLRLAVSEAWDLAICAKTKLNLEGFDIATVRAKDAAYVLNDLIDGIEAREAWREQIIIMREQGVCRAPKL